MTENTHLTKLNDERIYTLEVRIPDQMPMKVEVADRILAGIDPRNDLILIDKKIKAKHFLFTKINNILNMHYLGKDGDSFLNGHPLEKNKLYMLEEKDLLKVGKIEIIVRGAPAIGPISHSKTMTSSHLSSFLPSTPEHEEVHQKKTPKEEVNSIPLLKEPLPNSKTNDNIKTSPTHYDAIKLIPYKFYGFIVDMAFTYLLLSFVIPKYGLLSITQNFFYPLSEFISQFLADYQSSFTSMKIISIIEFSICFHILMITSSLILGTTPGAFLIGLHQKKSHKNILAIRFSAYIYALLNVFVLPLLLFDIPLYKGANLKELFSFSKRDLDTSIIFKILRRAVVPVVTVICFLSPFFLPPPYNTVISHDVNHVSKYKDVHTHNLSSYSREMGFSLKFDLNNQYALLPYFEERKIGLVLYDLKNQNFLLLQEQNRLSLSRALFNLRYANPFASLSIPNNQIENETLKNKSVQSLELSLSTLLKNIWEFGPFLANRFLFKEHFLGNFQDQGHLDNVFLNSFDHKNPAIKLSTLEKDEKVFLFTRKEIIGFTLSFPKQSKLLDYFTNDVLGAFRYDQSTTNHLLDPQILEVLEAFEQSNYSTILTYYINEAKKVQELNNPSWRAYFLKNVLQTKRALIEDKTRMKMKKNIETSFDDIMNTL